MSTTAPSLMPNLAHMRIALRELGSNKQNASHCFEGASNRSAVNSDGDSTHLPIYKPKVPLKLMIVLATLATLASLGIAIYAGWQSGGLLFERIMRISLTGIAVFVVHWLPSGWAALRGIMQVCALALWIVATSVVLFGQATFIMTAQRHAGDLRAATVTAPVVSANPDIHAGRSRTEIAREKANLSAALARVQIQPCIGDCPTLKVRRVRLAAEIAALDVEADEQKRHEADDDRRTLRAARDDDRREALRADPVAFPVATWLGTTERRLQLIVGFASAVVLEGAAILGWAIIAEAPGHDTGRSLVASDQPLKAPDRDPATEVEPNRAVMSDDDRLLDRIHKAVVAGELKPTQNAIRNFLRCGQPKAGKLNRLYMEKFGAMRGAAIARDQNIALSRLAIVEVK